MPNEGDTKPCKQCDGTMVFKQLGGIPGSRAGVGTPGGPNIWEGPLIPSWRCDKNSDHYELALPEKWFWGHNFDSSILCSWVLFT
jgi:hypothetical protein